MSNAELKKKVQRPWTYFLQPQKAFAEVPNVIAEVFKEKQWKKSSPRKSPKLLLRTSRKVVMPCQKFKGKNTIMHILHSGFLCVFPVIVGSFSVVFISHIWYIIREHAPGTGLVPTPPRYPSKGSPKPLRAKCRAALWKCTLNVHQMRVVHRIFVNVVWISCLLLIWCVFLRSLRMCSI